MFTVVFTLMNWWQSASISCIDSTTVLFLIADWWQRLIRIASIAPVVLAVLRRFWPLLFGRTRRRLQAVHLGGCVVAFLLVLCVTRLCLRFCIGSHLSAAIDLHM